MGILQSTLRLTLLDDVTAKSRRINAALNGLQRQSQQFMSPMRGLIGQAVAFGGAYLGITSGLENTYTAAANAQAALTEIGIKANLSTSQLRQMQDGLVKLSPKVNQTTTDLMAGVDAMVTMGTAAADAQGAMPAIGKTATATKSSINDLSLAASSAMQNLRVMPTEIQRMLDGMTSAGNAGAFEMRDMAQYFPQLTASAQFLGMEGVKGINDLAASLQIARRGAGDASTAANNLSDFMGKIVTPQTIKNFKKFGVDVTKELAKAKKNGISPIEHFIKLIDKKTEGGKGELLTQIFGDKQTLDFIKPMIAGFDDYLKIRDAANNANGTVAEAYLRRMQDADQKVKSFQISMQNLGESIGRNLLGPISDGAAELAHIFDTLENRFTIFDNLKAASEGFFSGLGVGGFKELMKDLETFVFGVEDGSAAADRYGKIFKDFREWGQDVRALSDSLKDNPLTKFIAEIGAGGFKLMLAAAAIGMLAGTVRKLAGAIALLTGLSTAWSILKTFGKLRGMISGAADAAGVLDMPDRKGGRASKGRGPTGPQKSTSIVPDAGTTSLFTAAATWMKGFGGQMAFGAVPMILGDTPGETFEEKVANQAKAQDGLRKLFGIDPRKQSGHPYTGGQYGDYGRTESLDAFIGKDAKPPPAVSSQLPTIFDRKFWFGAAADPDFNFRRSMGIETKASQEEKPVTGQLGLPASIAQLLAGLQSPLPNEGPSAEEKDKPVRIDASSIAAMVQPTGVQQVHVMNKEPPNVTVHAPISITGVSNPQAAADAAAAALGRQVKAAVESSFSD